MTEAALFAFFCVFCRTSALMMSSPIFGAQSTPLMVRIMATLGLSGAVASVVQPKIGPLPSSMGDLVTQVVGEIFMGVVIGYFITLALQAAAIGGALMDIQTGLSSGQTVNPVSGVSSTLLSQFKFMLSVVVFLSINGHHMMLEAMVGSYGVVPNLAGIREGLMGLISAVFYIGLKIALPSVGVGIIVDSTLGLLNRAVPQMQAFQIGMPVKILLGLITIAIGLPAITVGTEAATAAGFEALRPIIGTPLARP